MVVGLLGNECPDLNRFTLVTPKSENDVRLQATLDIRTPRACPWEQSVLFVAVLIPMSIFSFQNVHYVMGIVYIALVILYLGMFLRLFFDFRKLYQKK